MMVLSSERGIVKAMNLKFFEISFWTPPISCQRLLPLCQNFTTRLRQLWHNTRHFVGRASLWSG